MRHPSCSSPIRDEKEQRLYALLLQSEERGDAPPKLF